MSIIKLPNFWSKYWGVLQIIEGEYWLITASHVSNCHSEGQELYFQYQKNEFLSISGLFGETPFSQNSQMDFATIKLELLYYYS